MLIIGQKDLTRFRRKAQTMSIEKRSSSFDLEESVPALTRR
jgi:hypothetical protein